MAVVDFSVAASGEREAGTVVFLVTDIEGSTRRWERWPDAMAVALRRHDAIVRAAIEANAGSVFRTIGDAFCAAFAHPSDALDAALEIERALAVEDFGRIGTIRVRIALDIGPAERHANDFVGNAVERARLLAELGCGGRILASAAFAKETRATLRPGRSLVDLGRHALRGRALREAVFELRAPGLPQVAVALGSAPRTTGNLPQQLVRLVGRRSTVREVVDLLDEAHVVSLVGPGGVGKTQLAIAIGHEVDRRFPDGVWFVDLTAIVDANLVSSEIGAAFALSEAPRIPIADTVAAFLRTSRALIVIDNCEGLGGAVTAAMLPVVLNCPGVRVLTTGREPLPFAGSAEIRVMPLALPPASVASAAEAQRYDAVALFCERAAAIDVRFQLRDDDVRAVVEICRDLDGLPLALELAASKLSVLRPADLARRLGSRFRLLVGGTRKRDRHRQALRAVIDWSYEQLSADGRSLFRMLAAFGGSWTLEGAVALATIEPRAVEAELASLVDQSLVKLDDASPVSGRFRFFESARVYAHERLVEAGEFPAAKARLVARVRGIASDGELASRAGADASLLDAIEAELENVRRVLTWTLVERDGVADGAFVASALGFYWFARRHREGAGWLDLAQAAASQLEPRLAADVLRERARVEGLSRPKIELAFEAVAAQRLSGDVVGQTNALEYLVLTLFNVRRYAEVAPFIEEWQRLVEISGDRTTSCRILAYRGFNAIEGEGLDAARGYFERARSLALELGLPRDLGRSLRGLADVALESGDAATARDLARQALAVYEPLGEPRFQSWVRITLAHACAADRDFDEARQHVRESIRIYRDTDFTLMLFETFALAAAIEAAGSSDERAGLLLGYIDSRRSSLPFPWSRRTDALLENVRDLLLRRLGDEPLEALLARGSALDEERCASAILEGDA